MKKLIDFLISLNDTNKAKALYVNPQNFEDFAVDLVLNIKLQSENNRILVMSLDELLFYLSPDKSSKQLEAQQFVEELSSLIKK